jgi:O-methyltransferase involved in polyketide biosynthesis
MSEQENRSNRNFNSISPSAKSLMLLKGHTNIPFARQTAELLMAPEKYVPDLHNKDLTLWARILHFESRYWSVDQLIEDLSITNILELSSGFSFRGLEITGRKKVHYIDTDLPEVTEIKKGFISGLHKSLGSEGNLELVSLNVMNEEKFSEVVSHFSSGEIIIVNEGLLMYLDMDEKERLCKTIHSLLTERGGYWITADIYIKNKQEKLNLKIDNTTKDFFLKHNIEDNKFVSYEEAEKFFNRMGFIIDRKADVKGSKLSSLKFFFKSVTLKQLFGLRKGGKVQETWRLRIAP